MFSAQNYRGGLDNEDAVVAADEAHMNSFQLGGPKWEYEEIVLRKSMGGLGFSIAGGSDNPYVDNDPGIFVTKVFPGEAAANDGRLRKGDTIMRINNIDTSAVPHHTAVEALKAENVVQLYVKRLKQFSPKAKRVKRIEIVKGMKGLGLSIAGGIGNEHIAGDNGIFITRIIDGGAAHQNGRLMVGDKLLKIGGASLKNVTHNTAVNLLKNTSDRVVLTVEKEQYPPGIFNNSSWV